MPFDSLVLPEADTALYQARRNHACALWRAVPDEDFVMRRWRCGTTACAIGWLANARADGWRWHTHAPRRHPLRDYNVNEGGYLNAPIQDAADYFGMTYDQAFYLFHGRPMTADKVSDQLQALPITLPTASA